MKLVVFMFALLCACSHANDHYAENTAGAKEEKARLQPAVAQRLAQLAAIQNASHARPPLNPLDPAAHSDSYDLLDETQDLRAGDVDLSPGCHVGFSGTYAFDSTGTTPDYQNVSQWKQLASHQLALVCVQTETVPLEITPTGYKGGESEGECRAFRLADAKYLGGFKVNAHTSGQYYSTQHDPAETVLREDLEEQFASDIRRNVPELEKQGAFVRARCVWPERAPGSNAAASR